MQYSEFQNLPSSEKITLAIMSASRRLLGWVNHADDVYKIENVNFDVLKKVEDLGELYESKESIDDIESGSYFFDRQTKTIYLQASDDSNPNGRFLVFTVSLCFSNLPIALPHDLDEGYEVYFEPLIISNSEFGGGIDTINQTSEAIEGSGNLQFQNDYEFWIKNYDKYSFENQPVVIYSYHRDLDVSEAKLLFRGKIEKSSYSVKSINFSLKDQFAELRAPVGLALIKDIIGARVDENLGEAKQRMIFGLVRGHRPTNIDQVLEGYPLSGTITVSYGELNVVGVGTEFLSEVSPDDNLVIGGEEYSVATITDDTHLILTSEYEGRNISGEEITFIPDTPKRYINRVFKIAGHALRQPETEILEGSNVQQIRVADATDIYAGDYIYVGTLGAGELVRVRAVSGSEYIRLSTTLSGVPAPGTPVLRPAVQNVRIDDVNLFFERDYTLDADNGVLTLSNDAEANASPIYFLNSNITLTNLSRTVTGTQFLTKLKSGDLLGVLGSTEFFEILSIESDTSLTLRVPSTINTTAMGRYKSFVYNEGETILSCDCLGRTIDGTTTGQLIKTAPNINKILLTDAGLLGSLDTDSFDDAEEIAYQSIGIVIPQSYSDDEAPIYRDVLNKINKSVFGSLVLDNDLKFKYEVLRPKKNMNCPKFSESDLLAYSFNSTSENLVKEATVVYGYKEYNYLTKDESYEYKSKTNLNAQYISKTDRVKEVETVLSDESDAVVMANRWSFILSNSTGILSVTTKLQAANLSIGDIVEVEHIKFFDRFGGVSKRKLVLIESIKKSGTGVKFEATDLSNSFNRVATYSEITNDYSEASESQKLYCGFYTDEFGLIYNDPESFGSNLYW